MIRVDVKSQEAFEQALRFFNRKVHESDLFKELRSRSYFRKPSEKKRANQQQKQFSRTIQYYQSKRKSKK